MIRQYSQRAAYILIDREANISIPIIEDGDKNDAYSYFSLYLFFLICGAIMLSIIEDCPILYALFEYTSSLSTVGLSIGVTNPNSSPISLVLMMIAMIMGRLEMMVVFKALFHKGKSL